MNKLLMIAALSATLLAFIVKSSEQGSIGNQDEVGGLNKSLEICLEEDSEGRCYECCVLKEGFYSHYFGGGITDGCHCRNRAVPQWSDDDDEDDEDVETGLDHHHHVENELDDDHHVGMNSDEEDHEVEKFTGSCEAEDSEGRCYECCVMKAGFYSYYFGGGITDGCHCRNRAVPQWSDDDDEDNEDVETGLDHHHVENELDDDHHVGMNSDEEVHEAEKPAEIHQKED